jgi:hypothetical protein
MRLAIGGPTRDTVPASFAVDLAQLYAKTKACGLWSTVTIGFISATYIHAGREFFLESTLKQGATHVLWLDTDMSFPPETAIRLALHDQPIVACNYTTRDGSGQFTAMRRETDAHVPTRVETRAESTGLEAVDAVGMGVFLMRADVVATIPQPWFVHGQNTITRRDIGEDIMFCRALRAAGHTIYIDHDLSKEIGHIGQYTYRAPLETPVAV